MPESFRRTTPPLQAKRLGVATTLATTFAAAAWQAWLLARATRRGRLLAAASIACQSSPPRARSRVLVLGDSTGVGVGAGATEESLVGRLAQRFPEAEIVNHARNGARLRDLAHQAEALASQGQRFDLALLLAGGNDVLKHTSGRRLVDDARRLLTRLRVITRHTVWMGCADIGRAPAFVPPLSWWLSRRTSRTMQLLAAEARVHGAQFIDFTRPALDGMLADEFGFAEDGVHPNSASYQRCFAVLLRRAPVAHLLRRETAKPDPA